MAIAWQLREPLRPFFFAESNRLLGKTLTARPEIIGFVVAPYICATWDAPERIGNFIADVNTAEKIGPLLYFGVGDQIDVMKMDHLGTDFWLVIDKPIWFHREGIATINLFCGQVRLFTLAFSVQEIAGELVAMIGGIQGRNIETMLDLYRDMTKASAGMRPRDLLIEIFRSLCRHMNVSYIIAISDSSRHHRSSFFRDFANLTLDYDEIWSDRGGVRISNDFFQLSVARQDRDSSSIPAKKRAMYRKRYELLDALDIELGNALTCLSAHPISRRG